MDQLNRDISITKNNIELLRSGKDIVPVDSDVPVDESTRKALLAGEYETESSLMNQRSEVITKMNNNYYNTVSNIHYLVKLGYSMKELTELTPIELLVLQYAVRDIEEELAKQREKALMSAKSGGVVGDAST